MSKINNHNHLKNLAQRRNHDKPLGHKPKTTEKDNDKHKDKKKEEDPKCNWDNIILILLKVTVAIFINYIIGASTIYYLTHNVHNLDKDYPVNLEASPFCLYSDDNLEADNKVLEENNKILAGQCGIIQQVKLFFHYIIGDIMHAFILFKDFVVKTLPSFMQAIITAAGAFGAMAPEPKEGSGSSSGSGSGTSIGAAHKHKGAKPHKAKSDKAKHKGGSAAAAAAAAGSQAGAEHAAAAKKNAGHSQPKPKPKPNPRTEKDIADRRKDKDCEGFNWFGNKDKPMFGEKPGDQSSYGDLFLLNGPAWLAPRGTLTFVALCKYQAIMNSWLKWFINPLCTIIKPETANDYYAKVALGMFSSVIMAVFIVYFLVTHVLTTLQMLFPILGNEFGRYVASSSGTESSFYCIKENFSWIFAKLIPLIYVPFITTLTLIFPLLYSIWKFFFFGPYAENPVECNNILASIVVNIIFVWLSVLAYCYFTTYSSCPDDKFMKINDLKLVPFKQFPLIFMAAALPLFCYVSYRN